MSLIGHVVRHPIKESIKIVTQGKIQLPGRGGESQVGMQQPGGKRALNYTSSSFANFQNKKTPLQGAKGGFE